MGVIKRLINKLWEGKIKNNRNARRYNEGNKKIRNGYGNDRNNVSVSPRSGTSEK
jgi:hypothetical protein